ncbi:MAG TPA: hypothetical protein ENJ90_05410 [Devosia sp.]|nr:hypothetical protein [Devosia sp.]
MNPGPWGILIIVVAILLLFGRGKIAGMMGEVASGIKAFQRGMTDDGKAVEEKPADAVKSESAEKSTDA